MPVYEFEVTFSGSYFVAAPNEALAKAFVDSKEDYSWSIVEPEYDDVCFLHESDEEVDMAHEWVDEQAKEITLKEYQKLQELIEAEEREKPEPWPSNWPKPLPLPFDGVPLTLPELVPLEIKKSLPGLPWEEYKERWGIE